MKTIFKRLSALCLLLATCCALSSSAAAGFYDIPRDHWAYQAITDTAAKGYLQGSGGYFRPGESISKQAFLSMLCRASGLDDRSLQSGSDWADPAIAFGQYFGWLTPEEITDREAPMTREFAA